MGILKKIWHEATQPLEDVYHAAVPEPVRDLYTPTLEAGQAGAQDVAQWGTDALHNFTESAADFNKNTLGMNNKVADLFTTPSWNDTQRPGQLFYNDVNKVNKLLPTDTLRQYAPAIEGAALNLIPGVGWVASAAFNTLYNAGAMQANQKGMNWGDVGKNAAINFGSSYAGKVAGDWLKAGQTAQGGRDLAGATTNTMQATPSGTFGMATPAGYTGSTIQAGISPTSAGFGMATPEGFAGSVNTMRNGVTAGSAVTGMAPSTVAATDSFSMSQPGGWDGGIPTMSAEASGAAGAVPPHGMTGAQAAATTTPQTGGSSLDVFQNSAKTVPSLNNMGDNAYNSVLESQKGGDLVNQALTSTLAPTQSTALSGFDSGSAAGSGTAYQPTGSDVFNAFGGSALGNTDLISEDQYTSMQQALGQNAAGQMSGVRDQMLPAGQTEPDPNTPYSGQVSNIGKSYAQSGVDLANQVNTENYNRYNTNLESALTQANPNTITPEMFQGWLNDPTTRPEQFANYFQPQPSLIGF